MLSEGLPGAEFILSPFKEASNLGIKVDVNGDGQLSLGPLTVPNATVIRLVSFEKRPNP